MTVTRYLVLLIIFMSACQPETEHDSSNSDLFVSINPIERGIGFKNDLSYTTEQNIIEYLYYYNGGGVGVGDINNDGLEDVYLAANQKQDRLYLNEGDLLFKDISNEAGISKLGNWSTGVTIDDVNGDGWNDIYVCKVALVSSVPTHNELYLNQKDGTFREVSELYGLDFSGYSTQASFFDFDHDGDLDMYLLNHSVHSTRSYGSTDKRKEPNQLSGDRLFENKLNESVGKFIDVTKSAGIYSSALGYGLGLITSDINGDGWVDIYVGNDFHENDYYYVNNGDRTFTESIEQYFTHNSQFTMGVDAADINQDGSIDLFTTDMMPFESSILMKSGGNDTEQIVRVKDDFGFLRQYSRNVLQLNRDQGGFTDVGHMTNTYASDWSWSVLLQDFDNSGSTDILISNGIYKRPNDLDYINYINTPDNRQKENETVDQFNKRLMEQMPTLKVHNLLFKQSEQLTFSDISDANIGMPSYSNGTAYADFDKDGDLDIIANNINDEVSLLENTTENNHFIAFHVKGSKNAKIKIYTELGSQLKEYTTTRGYQSSCSHFVHFGLGTHDSKIDSVEVHWLDGSVQKYYDLALDQYHSLVRENKNITIAREIQETVLSNKIKVLPIRHFENEFDDFDNEPLMLSKLSKQGPAAVLEDFDGDGIKDLFIGGAHNQSAQYYKGGRHIPFQKIGVASFESDKRYEDVDAAPIDFNNDGYLDLYVVSGGNQYNELSPELQDRLYINDKKGGFYRLEISLPHTNGSTISVADFDGDGFDDLFIGASNIPGAYGLNPISFIIRNVQSQRLEIVYKDRMGQLTDSQWKDLNGDGNPELIVVGHWMSLKIFGQSVEGGFIDLTDQYGIPKIKGLFEAVEIADINQDGKLDFILGNWGLNTALSTSDNQSIAMYLGDFDQNSFIDPVIFHSYFKDFIPFYDKATLQSQVPTIKKNIESFERFSQINSLKGLFANEEAVQQKKEIDKLASVMFISDDNSYKEYDLPIEAQTSSISDFYWSQVEGGGKLYYVGNSKAHSHAVGNNLASRGGILTNYNSDKHEFLTSTTMGLPIGTVSKKILPSSSEELLIINNDNIQHLLYIN